MAIDTTETIQCIEQIGEIFDVRDRSQMTSARRGVLYKVDINHDALKGCGKEKPNRPLSSLFITSE